MEIKGKPTPALRQKLHDLVAGESAYPISEELIDRFVDSGVVIRLRSGEAITRSGEVDPDYYILAEGIMRCWHPEGEDGVERTSYFGMPGTLCVSYHSFLLGQPSPNTHEACCPCTVVRIRREAVKALIETSPEFARWCLGNAQFQLYFFEMRGRVIQGPARERYEAIVKRRPEIIKNVPLKMIASYLGITPQYLSKLRRQVK